MICSHVVKYGEYRNFRCQQIATVGDFCEDCSKLGIRDNFCMDRSKLDIHKCLFVTSISYYKGFACQDNATKDGLCDKCCSLIGYHTNRNTKDSHNVLNRFSTYVFDNNLDLYLSRMTFTQDQLNTALRRALKENSSGYAAKMLLFYKGFFPDICGYDFMLEPDNYPPSQSILSAFFYKRFLIKSSPTTQPDI